MAERTALTKAFLMGFMVSREGYNGECAVDNCAPDKLECRAPVSDEKYIKSCKTNSILMGFCDEAVKIIIRKKGGK